jgi:TonB family protein
MHLLFLGYFGMMHSTESEPKVFDVKIVSPADITEDSDAEREEIIPKEIARKKDPVPARKPVIVHRRPRPVDIDNSVKPDVVFGEGLGEAQKDATVSEMKEDSAKPKGLDSGSAEKEDLPSGIREIPLPGIDGPALSPGDFLFDKQTIEKYASRGTQEGAGIQDGKGFMFYAPEFKNRAYMRMLRDRIESIWKYPEEAARRRLTGDLYIKFVIRRNGKLDKVELVRTSGHRELDEAAIQALKKADPYWPLPENYDKEVLEITGHFIYVMGSPYVM